MFIRFGQATGAALAISLAMPLVWPLAVGLARGYALADLGTGSEEYRRIVRAGFALASGTAVVCYAVNYELARGFVLLALPVACLLSLVARYLARQNLSARRARGSCLRTVLLVGHTGAVLDLARQLRSDTHYGMRVVGACVPGGSAQGSAESVLQNEGVAIVGDLSGAARTVRSLGVDTVAVTSGGDTTAVYLRQLSWQLEGSGVDLLVAPGLMEVAGPRLHVKPFVGLPLLHVQQPTFSGVHRFLKAVLDRTAAAVGLLLLSPLLVVIAVCIRLDSHGPVLFRQERVGLGGQPFTMMKFRTMVDGAEAMKSALLEVNEGCGLLFKLRTDPRVTRVGAVLRRYSLDELPQLLNVLLGSMSLVGPRPPLADEVSRYEYHVHRRLLVQPGLTGLWQISGRSDLGWEESVRLDLRYVENWTLLLDLLILWKTIGAVLRVRGAY